MSQRGASPPAFAPDGWPLVEPKSSLVDFLELCHVGACVKSEVLKADVQKRIDGLWTGYGKTARTSLQLLVSFRAELLEFDEALKEADLDKMHTSIDPVDPIRVKREVAARHEDAESASEEEDTVQPRTLAVIDISGDGENIETETFDGGASSSPAKPFAHMSPYGAALRRAALRRAALSGELPSGELPLGELPLREPAAQALLRRNPLLTCRRTELP
jgi:hypothetical protein